MQNVWLQTLQDAWQTVQDSVIGFAAHAPQVSAAVLVFVYGFLLAELVYRLLIALSSRLRLELISEKIGLTQFLRIKKSTLSSSHFIAKTVKGYLVFFFFVEATKEAGLGEISAFLSTVMSYIPSLLIAFGILLVGWQMSNTSEILIKSSLHFAKAATAVVVGRVGKGIVFSFAVLAALAQLEIADILIHSLFIGLVAMLALAGALAFGLGGRTLVEDLLGAARFNKRAKAERLGAKNGARRTASR